MTTLWTTCKNAYWREARSCSNYSWLGFSPWWPARPIYSFKWQFLCEPLSHRVHFYSDFLNMVCVCSTFHFTEIFFNTECTLQIFVMQKYHRNRWQPYEPHAITHIGEKHVCIYVVAQITSDVVSLHGGQSYAPSSDSFDVTICLMWRMWENYKNRWAP